MTVNNGMLVVFFMMIWVEVFNTKTNDCTIEIVNDQLGT